MDFGDKGGEDVRLIDADALISIVETARKKAKTLTGMDFVMVIKGQPTIPAIPVEWIENVLTTWIKGKGSFEACGAVSALLVRWQKEQEAR